MHLTKEKTRITNRPRVSVFLVHAVFFEHTISIVLYFGVCTQGIRR